MKKKHLIILAALTLSCLSGCHKDKPVETQAPLETIAPETQAESTGDKLDGTSADIEISPIKNLEVLSMIQEHAKRYAAQGSVAAGTRGRVT